MMAVTAAILPGIPTLPFLLLTARHAIRLSPSIERSLRSRPWSAEFLSRLERSGNLLRLDWRSFLKMLLIADCAVAVMFIVNPPLGVVIGLEIGIMAFVCLPEMGRQLGQESTLSVPAC
jgi:uncharacterized membrane protein YbaN (DUF454 family)